MPGFYKDAAGQIIGPISSAELLSLARKNAIAADTLIAKTPQGPWVPAGKVKALSGLLERDVHLKRNPCDTPDRIPSAQTSSQSAAGAAGFSETGRALSGWNSRIRLAIGGGLLLFVAIGISSTKGLLSRGQISGPEAPPATTLDPIGPSRPPGDTVESPRVHAGLAQDLHEAELVNRRIKLNGLLMTAPSKWEGVGRDLKSDFTRTCLEAEKQVPYDARGPLTSRLVDDQQALEAELTNVGQVLSKRLDQLSRSLESAAESSDAAAWDAAINTASAEISSLIKNSRESVEKAVAARSRAYLDLAKQAASVANSAAEQSSQMQRQIEADKARVASLGEIKSIKALTPENAAAIVRNAKNGSGFRGGMPIRLDSLAEITPAVAKELSACVTGLALPAVTSLSPEAASCLAQMAVDKDNWLALENLERLDAADLARTLARNKELRLPKVHELSQEVAAALAGFEGYLDLGAVTGLSPEAADALAACSGTPALSSLQQLESPALARKLGAVERVELHELVYVSDAAAAALCSGNATLSLPKLRSLTSEPLAERLLRGMNIGGSDFHEVETLGPAAAKALSRHKKPLRLPAVKALDAASAAALSSHAEAIEFGVLERIDREAGDALAEHVGPVFLPALTDLSSAKLAKKLIRDGRRRFVELQAISPEVAEAFAEREFDFDHNLDFSGMKSLPLDVARRLMGIEGVLTLDGLTEMPLPLAQVLATFEGRQLVLQGVRDFSKEAQDLIGTLKDDVSLGAVDVVASRADVFLKLAPTAKSITPEVAAVLARTEEPMTLSVLTLPPEVAEALSDYVGEELKLNSLRSLPLESAKYLGRMRLARLELNALEELPGPVAASLTPFGPKHRLSLPGLMKLEPETAAVLAQSGAYVDLRGLKSLNAEAAAALAAKGNKSSDRGFNLEGICDLTPEAASGLAKYRGDLQLPSVKTITPEVARSFASHKGALVLGIMSIDDESIEWLSKHRDRVSIRRVRQLTRRQFDRIEEAGNFQHTVDRDDTRRIENPD